MSEKRDKLDAGAFCALPLVRRGYMALVAGVAVFVATLVVLREPFRGYLAEVRIGGPATEGLDLEDAARWLKQADARVVVLATSANEHSPRNVLSLSERRQSSQIRMTFLAPLPTPATSRLDELAAKWLYQYLPQRMNAFRHAELAELRTALAECRVREDAAQLEVEEFRQRQLALVMQSGAAVVRSDAGNGQSAPTMIVTKTETESDSWRQQIESMQVSLARLLARFTEEHPEVIALRSQIERLEQLLQEGERPSPGLGPELIPAPPADRQATARGLVRPAAVNGMVSRRAEDLNEAGSRGQTASELGGAVAAALTRLTRAGRERQLAEQRLSDRMQELSSQLTAAEWSAEPAHVVTRLGGTPRCATLALGGLLAVIGGAIMFRGSAVVVQPGKIESVSELASALEIPVIGNVAALRKATTRMRRRLFTAGRVRVLVHLAEAIVGVAMLACLLAIVVEPSLARQVLADPFGTLSEVMGRLGV